MPSHWPPWPGKTNTTPLFVTGGAPRLETHLRHADFGRQLLLDVAGSGSDDRAPKGSVRPSQRRRGTHGRHVRTFEVGQLCGVADCQRLDGVWRARRQRQHERSARRFVLHVRLRLGRGSRGRLGEDDVCVGSGNAEGTHPSDSQLIRSPRLESGPYRHPEFLPAHRWRRHMAVQARGHAPMLQGQRHLDQSGHASGAFGVTEVGLDRADDKRSSGARPWPSTSPSAASSTGSPARAGAMCLHVLHVLASTPAEAVRASEERHLAVVARRSERAARWPSLLTALPRITA